MQTIELSVAIRYEIASGRDFFDFIFFFPVVVEISGGTIKRIPTSIKRFETSVNIK